MTLHKGNIFYVTPFNIYHIQHVSHDMCRHNSTHSLWHIIRLTIIPRRTLCVASI